MPLLIRVVLTQAASPSLVSLLEVQLPGLFQIYSIRNCSLQLIHMQVHAWGALAYNMIFNLGYTWGTNQGNLKIIIDAWATPHPRPPGRDSKIFSLGCGLSIGIFKSSPGDSEVLSELWTTGKKAKESYFSYPSHSASQSNSGFLGVRVSLFLWPGSPEPDCKYRAGGWGESTKELNSESDPPVSLPPSPPDTAATDLPHLSKPHQRVANINSCLKNTNLEPGLRSYIRVSRCDATICIFH